MRPRALAGVAGASLLTSCSLLVDLTGLGGGTADGSTTDGSGDSAGGNLLANADFEHSVGGCSPGWSTNGTTMNAVDASHSGGFACEVCLAVAGKSGYFSAPTIKSPPLGSTYFVEAWLMIEPDASLSEAALYIQKIIPNGSATFAYQTADLKNGAWQQLNTTTGAFDDAGTGVRYNIYLQPLEGGTGCVLVDDTQMVQLSP